MHARGLSFTPLRLMSVGLMFLLVFRTQSAYNKWLVARNSWGKMTVACRDIASNVSNYCHDLDAVTVVCRYLILYVISIRSWLRQRELSAKLIGRLVTPRLLEMLANARDESTGAVAISQHRRRIVDDDSLGWQFKSVAYPLVMIESLRAILQFLCEHKTIAPFQGSLEASLRVMVQCLCEMEAVQDTELPLSYIIHIRTTIAVFFLVTPFFLTEDSGWFGLAFIPDYRFLLHAPWPGEFGRGFVEPVRARQQRPSD
ncbi:unnamed protein product [Prorocentrum cordatum]|uniref:Peroxisomal membrane protein PEX16 n=2 Tax=Prorocentrum cordatum TaxID=2364126 RepID=A0ABN9Q9D6_9DINO|nr:unnamed protein product [Polarella glacialis]